MSKDIDELREAWKNLPEGMEDWITLYKDGNEVASVYKSKRDFDEVFCLEDQYPYVWWLTSEVAIVFDHWEVEMICRKNKDKDMPCAGCPFEASDFRGCLTIGNNTDAELEMEVEIKK